MPTLPSGGSHPQPHDARRLAESFGEDPEHYDRTRPHYPEELVARIVDLGAVRDVLDVGIGTGISARAFQAAGCNVLGVDPDRRMAEFARAQGFEVDVATFETWDPAGRTFDAVVAGQSWHWVDPVAGAVKAARVLRPGGRLAVFWNAMEFPPVIGSAFARAFREAVTEAAELRADPGGPVGYSAFVAKAADGLREAGMFRDAEQWQLDWEHDYTRDEWLDVMTTGAGFNRLGPRDLHRVLEHVGAAIDAAGGSFTMQYATLVVSAARADAT